MKCTVCHNTNGFTTRVVKGMPDGYQCNLCGHMWKKTSEDYMKEIFPSLFKK